MRKFYYDDLLKEVNEAIQDRSYELTIVQGEIGAPKINIPEDDWTHSHAQLWRTDETKPEDD